MLTIVIPARNELYLNQTVDDIYAKATGRIEVIVVLDDCWNMPLPADRPNLTIVHWGKRVGMRAAINAGAEIGRGEIIMKVDAHVSFSVGFDELLTAECDVDWVVTPRRYSLDLETWGPKKNPPWITNTYPTLTRTARCADYMPAIGGRNATAQEGILCWMKTWPGRVLVG